MSPNPVDPQPANTSQPTTGGVSGVKKVLRWFTAGVFSDLEEVLRWLTAYPVYPLQVLLILLIAFGGLGAELGAEHLFWHEDWWYQLGVGFFVGLLFGANLFVEYLSNRPTQVLQWIKHLPTLFPISDKEETSRSNEDVRSLGRVLLWGLLAALMLMYVLKGITIYRIEPDPETPDSTRWAYFKARAFLWPFGVGYLLSIGFARVLFWFDQRGGFYRTDRPLREKVLDWPINLRARLRNSKIPPNEDSIHGIGVVLTVTAVVILIFLLVLAVVYDNCFAGDAVTTPVSLVAILMILFSLLYGFAEHQIPPDEQSIHRNRVVRPMIAIAVLGTLLAAIDGSFFAGGTVTTISLVLILLILLSFLYGVVAFYFHMQRLGIVALAVALMCWNSTSLFDGNNYKIRFPGLTYDGDRDGDLKRLTMLWKKGEKGEYEDVLKGSEKYAKKYLIPSVDPVQAMSKRWAQQHGGARPKLIFIATSGGGVRAAVWTAEVLNHLETEPELKNGGFRNNIRMITGASGGMVAAALYAADFEHGPDQKYAEVLGADSLNRTAQSLVLRDIIGNTFQPPWRPSQWDRGQTLEWKWKLNAEKILGRANPFGRTFAKLRAVEKDGNGPSERDGSRPSLVFTPMMIEDSRRLLISNLNLEDLTTIRMADGSARLVPAVEFHRLFPDVSPKNPELEGWKFATSEEFHVGTAARMSATFPVISPAVSLPTNPPRRVVDAGYYDNYGLNLVALWIWKHREDLKKYTSGVAIIEIRAFPLHKAGSQFGAIDPQTGTLEKNAQSGDLFTDAAAAVSAPLEALFTARGNIAYYRNTEWVEVLQKSFEDMGPNFLYNGWFELTRPASLNWYLTSEEKKAIKKGYETKEVTDQVTKLRDWYGTGGKVMPKPPGP
jgi:hypothetical protein